MLFRLLCDPGDDVCVAYPAYPLFDYLAALEGIRLQPYHLRRTPLDTWRISFPSLEEAIGERTRAVVVVNPSNPAGNYLQSDELRRLDDLCAARDLALIVDEVFCDYAHIDTQPARTVGGMPRALRFTLNGISKLLGLPQLKLGWIVTEGPDDLRAEAVSRLDVIADAYLGTGTPVMEAAERLLSLRADIQAQILSRCRTNLDLLQRELGARILAPEGGWNAVISLDPGTRDEQWALDLLSERHVLVHPGYLFDFPQGAYAVVSLLPEEHVFAEGIRRITAFLQSGG